MKKTAEYELASLPEGSFLVELVDRGGDVFCTEGPFEIAGDRLLYESQNIACSDSGPRWWVPFLAAAAAGTDNRCDRRRLVAVAHHLP